MPESTFPSDCAKAVRLPTAPIAIPAVDGPGAKYTADIKAADDCLTAELAAAADWDERHAAHRTHRAAYDSAAAVFYSDWRAAWDAACDATWGPVRPLERSAPDGQP